MLCIFFHTYHSYAKVLIEEINANLIDLLESHIDDEEREINDKDKLFEEDDDK